MATLGAMRYRIDLINPKKKGNGRGGWLIDYESGDRLQTWAAAQLLSIGQQLRYNQNDAAASISFEIRENPFVSKETRILFEGRTYSITAIGPGEGRERLRLDALEV